MNLRKALEEETNIKLTENGAKIYRTTNSDVLDFYTQLGTLRGQHDKVFIDLFNKSYNENPILTIKALFYARDIKEGLGERRLFRVCMKEFINKKQVLTYFLLILMEEIIRLGRFDDLYEIFEGTDYERDMWNYYHATLMCDLKKAAIKNNITLAAKWMPNPNASDKRKRVLAARFIRNNFSSKKEYLLIRKFLNRYLDTLECNMCENKWGKIDFNKIPSMAFNKYNKAWYRHLKEELEEHLDKVQKGKGKINASSIYPADIFKAMNMLVYPKFNFYNYNKAYETQWNSLPDFVDKKENYLVIADTSGSMLGTPMDVALSLAIYFAQRNKGLFKNSFITFSDTPEFVTFKDKDNLREIIENVRSIVSSTNLEATFKLILDAAVKNNIPSEEMPKSLIIITDMQFNSATSYSGLKFMASMRKMYKEQGYILPNIIFWNVNSNGRAFAVEKKDGENVQMVSGYSPTVFKQFTKIIGQSPYEAMCEVLSNERYSFVDYLTFAK